MEHYVWIGQAIDFITNLKVEVFPVLRQMADHFNVELSITGPRQFDREAYIQAIYDAVENGADGIILFGWGGELEIVAAVDHAMDNGVPVVITGNDILNAKRLACVSTDWGGIGANMGRWVRRQIPTQGTVLMLGYSGVSLRQLGFKYFAETFQRDPGIKVIQPNQDEPQHYETMKPWIEQQIRDIDDLIAIAVFEVNVSMKTTEVVEQLGLADKIKLVTVDITEPQCEYIRKGVIDATICFNRGAAAARAFQLLHHHRHRIMSSSLTTAMAHTPVHLEISHALLTRENIDRIDEFANIEAYMATSDLTQQVGLLSSMIEKIDEIAIAANLDGQVKYVNPATERVLGHPRQEIQNHYLYEIFDIPREIWQDMQSKMAAGESTTLETVINCCDNRNTPVQITASPLSTGTALTGMAVIATDLSEQKKTERQLLARHEEESQFLARQAALTDVRNELSLLDNRDDLARRAVELGREKLGFDRIGLYWIDHEKNTNQGTYGIDEHGRLIDLHQQVTSPISDVFYEARETRFILQKNAVLQNDNGQVIGHRDAVLISIMGDDTTSGMMGIDNFLSSRELTENDCELAVQFASTIGHILTRIVAGQKIAEERNLLRSVIEALPAEIFVKNLDNRYLLCNERFAQSKLGVSSDQAAGLTTSDNITERDLAYYQDQDRQLLEHGQPLFDMERKVEQPGGPTRWEHISKLPLKDSQGKIVGIIGMAQDITSLRTAEDTLLDINRKEAEHRERLMQMIAARETLAEISDAENICKQAIHIGREKLGYDRMGLWFIYKHDYQKMQGSFGTDQQGNVVDRSNQHCQVPEAWQKLSDTRTYYLAEHGPFNTNGDDDPLEDATRLIIPFWNGQRPMGFLVIDNAFNHKPFSERDCELATAYASTIGHLVARQWDADILKEEQNLLRSVINTLPAQIFVKDLEGRYLISNTAFEAKRGSSNPEEIIGKTTYELFPERNAKIIAEGDDLVLKTGKTQVFEEYPIIGQDGETIWETTTKAPLFDTHGQIMGIVGMSQDITRIKQADETLRQNEAEERRLRRKLRTLLDVRDRLADLKTEDELARLAVDLGRTRLGLERTGIWLLGDDPNLLYGYYGTDEHGLETIDRWGQTDSINRLPVDLSNISRSTPYVVFEQNEPLPENNYETGTVVFAPIRDGDKIIAFFRGDNMVRHSPITQRDYEFIALYASTIGQIYTRQKADLALARERNLMRTVIDNLPMKIFVSDRHDRYIVCNTEFAIERGRQSIEQVMGLTTDDLYSSTIAANIKKTNDTIYETGKGFTDDEFPFWNSVGHAGWQSVSKTPLKDEQGNIIGIVGLSREITNYKLSEEALRESEEHYRQLANSNRRLLREVNHRVRNNLASLLSLLTITRERAKTVDDFSKAMEQRISAMSQIHNLLAEAEWRDLELHTLVSNLIKSFHQAGTHAIDFEIDGPPTPISSSQALPLAMTLLELFINSTKYGAHTSPDGHLSIHWTAEPDPRGAYVTLHWTETGGPPIDRDPTPSLGTELIQGFINFELGGKCRMQYPPTGANHRFKFTALATDTPVPQDIATSDD